MGSLADCFGHTMPIRLATGTYPFRELTIGDLCDLQAWAALQVPPPWDLPPSDDPEAITGALYNRARDWPPRVDTGAIVEAIGPAAWYAKLLTVSPGLDDDDAVINGAFLASPDGESARLWAGCAWFGDPPKSVALRMIERAVGKPAKPPGDPPDWPAIAAKLCEVYPGLTLASIRDMTQSEFRTYCDKGQERLGSFTQPQMARVHEIRAKGETLLSGPASSETAAPDPGPSSPA
jgi:hypothetical protein